ASLGGSLFPRLQGSASLTWNRRNWSASWTSRYNSWYWANVTHTVVVNQGSDQIPSELFHDVQLTYRFDTLGDRWSLLSDSEVRLGVQNLFNRHPSVDVSNTNGFYSLTSDPRLASYWLSFRKSFGR